MTEAVIIKKPVHWFDRRFSLLQEIKRTRKRKMPSTILIKCLNIRHIIVVEFPLGILFVIGKE